MRQKLIDLITTLVAFPSDRHHPEAKRDVLDWVDRWLVERQITTEQLPHPDSPALMATLPGDRPETILFLAHLDVVPADEEMFTVTERDGRLFGRGVLDDKGPAAIILLLLEQLRDQTDRPTIQYLATTDEEEGSQDSLQQLITTDLFDGVTAVVALDGGGARRVLYREKGVIHLRLQASGQTAHGAYPWKGDNPLTKAWQTIEQIKSIFSDQSTDDPGHWYATVTPTMFQAGQTINQIPDQADFALDIRFPGDHSPADVLQQIKGCLPEGVSITEQTCGHPLQTDPEYELLQSYIVAMTTQLEAPVKLSSGHGASDGRFFSERDIPVWIHCPDGDGIHAPEEWLDLASAEGVLAGLTSWLTSFSDQ